MKQINNKKLITIGVMMVNTRDYPSLIFYDTVRLGRGFNYVTHKIFEKIM